MRLSLSSVRLTLRSAVINDALKAAPIGASDHLDSYSLSKDALLNDGELIISSIIFG